LPLVKPYANMTQVNSMAHIKKPFDVIVIGAGVIGSSIAYHLSRQKVKVLLLEKGDIAEGSSGACDGMVFLQSKKPGIHLQLALESRNQFAQIQEALPYPIEYRECGGLVVIETQDEWIAMQHFVKEQQGAGLNVSLLTVDEVKEIEPHLSEHILGATYSPLDGQVNPISLSLGFALGAKALGSSLMINTSVYSIDIVAGSGFVVETQAGRFNASMIVNATGVHAPSIGAMVGVDIPIKPRRGQILVTEKAPSILNHCMISAQYIAAKYNPEIAAGGCEGISIEQTESGNLLLGSTREFAGFDKRTTAGGLQRIAANTTSLIPMLKQVNVIRSFAGLRPYTPDGMPILGPVESVPGFYIAAGHEGDGVALAPITGERIAKMIIDGKVPASLDCFGLDRFAPTDTIAEMNQ
jgi:glycine/D-amino acid oxidase-like deaminating enzyme